MFGRGVPRLMGFRTCQWLGRWRTSKRLETFTHFQEYETASWNCLPAWPRTRGQNRYDHEHCYNVVSRRVTSRRVHYYRIHFVPIFKRPFARFKRARRSRPTGRMFHRNSGKQRRILWNLSTIMLHFLFSFGQRMDNICNAMHGYFHDELIKSWYFFNVARDLVTELLAFRDCRKSEVTLSRKLSILRGTFK